MSQKLPVNGFKWIKETLPFIEGFIESYSEKSDEEYFLEVDVQYSGKLHELHNDIPFLPERMKIHKVYKLVANLHDKKYMLFTQTLNHGLVLKKVHRAIKFNQKPWLKPCIELKEKPCTELRQKAKNNFEKDFFKLMDNSVFGKTIENVRKYTDIKLVTKKKKLFGFRTKLSYHRIFFLKFISHRNEKKHRYS